MSRFSQYNKNDTYRDNFKYANLQKERRTNEELQEIERDRKAMERLQIQLDEEKKLEKERKNQIKQQQYEDYSNYMRQKYAETPQNREKLNIKVGGEQRFIRKPNYNQQMDNLCLNPTKQRNVYPTMPVQNYSEVGRNYQRGYSHGYNILTGEAYSQGQVQAGRQTPKVISNNNNNSNFAGYNEIQSRISKTEYPKGDIQNNVSDNKEKEDLSQYQAYMEMKRQKEQEGLYYLNQQKEKEKQLDNKNIEQSPNNFNEIKQKDNYEEPNLNLNQNEIPPEYRDMYMRQQLEQQQRQEMPPEYKEMLLREQMEQKQKQLERQQRQEIPPEYKEMYLRKQMEQEQQGLQKELERQQRQEIPPEYKEMYLRRQMEQEQQALERQQKENLPQNQQQISDKPDEKSKMIPLEQPKSEEVPEEYSDIMQQQSTQKHGRSTPYKIKMNNFINPKQNSNYEDYNPKIEQKEVVQENSNDQLNKEKENNLHQEKISEEDYKSYMLSQQKEKEDENMAMYQNMLREQEKEKEKQQMQNNQEREQYYQYLLSQQQKENKMQNNQEMPEMKEKQTSNQKINPNEPNEKPINTFDEYYKQKGMNIKEQPPQMPMMNKNISESQYQNYPQNMQQQPQELGYDEQQEYLMYQQQQRQMQELEERERVKKILERQQMEKMHMNDNNIQNENYPQGSYYDSPYNNEMQMQIPERKSEFSTAKMEYLQNKQKNMLSRDNIFSVSEVPKPPPKYNNEPLTNADRLRIQREYAQFLDAQINAKMIKNSKNRNNGLGQIQNTGYDIGGPNPYQQLREKHNKLKDIPQDPYSVKNYNISQNSYLTSNPITNPVNSYKFVDRRKSSGRLQNNGSNVIGK
jgi:hypothetical protein